MYIHFLQIMLISYSISPQQLQEFGSLNLVFWTTGKCTQKVFLSSNLSWVQCLQNICLTMFYCCIYSKFRQSYIHRHGAIWKIQLGCRMLRTVSHTNDLFSTGFSLLGNFLKAVCTWQFAVVGCGLTKVKMISTGVLVCLWALSLTRVQMTRQIICANNGINAWYILSVRLLHALTLQLLQTLPLQLLWNLDSPCWQNCMAILSQKTAISSVSFIFIFLFFSELKLCVNLQQMLMLTLAFIQGRYFSPLHFYILAFVFQENCFFVLLLHAPCEGCDRVSVDLKLLAVKRCYSLYAYFVHSYLCFQLLKFWFSWSNGTKSITASEL